jgi:hypothetical protein
MTKTTHTPGPWTIDSKDSYPGQPSIIGGDGTRVALCPQRSNHPMEPHPLTEDNARLISSAPSLLAALEKTEATLRWAAQEAKGKVKAEIVGGWIHHADQARAAIAKAKGE